MRASSSLRRGFTLIEMSIVLIIIGLISGGILTAVSMRHAAALRRVMTDTDSYKRAVTQFQTKYNALPGDMANATSFWGIAAGTTGNDAACQAADETNGKATCNGNGDGYVGYTSDGVNRSLTYEMFLLWKHLQNAGLITGTYNGQPGSASSTDAIPGTNVPLGPFGGGYTLEYEGAVTTSASSTFFPCRNCQHWIQYGSPTNYETNGPILSAEETQALDVKVDDGLPGLGQVRTMTSGATSCSTTSDPTNAVYNTTYPGMNCQLIFLLGF